jgi:5-formyltetrahydrofolate cyclo-ligase
MSSTTATKPTIGHAINIDSPVPSNITIPPPQHSPKTLTNIKNEHRNRIKTVLKSYPREVIQAKSAQTEQTILTHPALSLFHQAKSIAIFYPLPHEFQTFGIIERILDEKKHLFLPRVIAGDLSATANSPQQNTMELFEF